MNGRARSLLALAIAVSLIAFGHSATSAQGLLANTTKLVVPSPPGSGTDLVARVLAERLARKWGTSVIVENISGAGSNIGAAAVARAAPDGQTLLFAPPNPIVINRYLYKNLSYDQTKFVPVALVAKMDYALVTRKNFPAATVSDLIKLSKERPDKITHASPGVGSTGYLASLEFEQQAGIKLNQVPYRGLAPALKDVSGGHVDIMFDTITTSLPLFRAGVIGFLGVTSLSRLPELPDIPTVAESGVPNFQANTWFGIVAPPGTPADIADRINRDVSETLREQDVNSAIRSMYMAPQPGNREQAASFFAAESSRWGEMIKRADIQPE